MPNLLDRLDDWKRRFGPPETGQLERLLAAAAKYRVRDAAGLIRLHETLLFLRAYPRTPEVARLADAILFAFADRVARLRAAVSQRAKGTCASTGQSSAMRGANCAAPGPTRSISS